MAVRKIRMMIVDDSVIFREFMSQSLAADPSIEVVGVASDTMDALRKTASLQPDVLVLDIEMPKVSDTEFLRLIRSKHPHLQVVVISSVSSSVFEALGAGAVDFVSKPNSQFQRDSAAFIAECIQKITIAAAHISKAPPPVLRTAAPARPVSAPSAVIRNAQALIAIGASTGGTEAILAVLRELPANMPGILIVQHMPPVFTRMFAERLDRSCRVRVREAQNGEKVQPGTALIAPGGERHMRLIRDMQGGYSVRLDAGEKVSGHVPSVDVLFESVAKAAGKNAVGVILTGMGADGAKQLLEMRKAGAHTIGQDRESCVVYGMPMVAYDIGGVAEQLPLSSISGAILRRLSQF